MAPDRVPAELALVGLDPLGDEPAAALRSRAARRRSPRRRRPPNAGASSASSRTSFFIRHRASIESQLRSDAEFWSRPSSASSTPPRVRSMTARRLSVADSWAKFSIQWIFQCRSWMSIASSSTHATSASVMPSAASSWSSRYAKLRCISGTRRSRHQSAKWSAVDGQDGVEVGAHRAGERGVARHPRAVAGAVLRAVDPQVGVGRDRRRVDVAVDVLGQPVDGERRAEPPEHVVAAQPPAADVEEHRAHGVGDVEVVVDPEQVPLGVRGPVHRERVVAEELAQDLLRRAHWLGPPTPAPRTAGDRQSFDHR